MQKKVAFTLNWLSVSSTNSVGPETGPSSNVRYNLLSTAGIRQTKDGYNNGRKKGVR
jgi:hypothetical protein